jgi:general stress protein 26
LKIRRHLSVTSPRQSKCMTQTRSEDLDKLRAMIKDIDFCMLTTIDQQGDPHSRPMSSNGDIDPNGDLWFFTAAATTCAPRSCSPVN